MGMVDHRFDIVDRATFRNGMSRLGASVNVVTTYQSTNWMTPPSWIGE